MDDIILAVIMKENVVSIRELVRKTGFREKEIRGVLNRLSLRGKVNLIFSDSRTQNICSKCPLNKICHLNSKGGVKIGIN